MNLIQNEDAKAKNKNTKTIMTLIIVSIIVLVVISICLICAIYYMQNSMMKLTINGREIATLPEDLFITQDGTTYVSIHEFAKLVGYKSYNGDHASEGIDKGYIQNDYEEAAFSLDSSEIYKTLLKNGNTEYFTLAKPIKMINNKLYMSIDGMQIAATCVISYNASNNQYTVYTLTNLVSRYSARLTNLTMDTDFNNQKAILYGMIVVRDANENYGAISLDGKEIIGTKYKNIEFVESSKDFIVKTDENKMGILSSNGATKIQANYDEIKQINKDLNLYLVKNDKKYGVINQNGQIIVHIEYDDIGVDTTLYTNSGVRKQYVLFENCIPVRRDKKFGMYDVAGKQIIPVEYDGFGCTVGSIDKTLSNPVLTIDKYEAIVVEKEKKYGLINKSGKVLLPCVLDSIYSTIIDGQTSYYMAQGENKEDLVNYIDKYIIKTDTNIDITGTGNMESENTNTALNTNTVSNTDAQNANTVLNDTTIPTISANVVTNDNTTSPSENVGNITTSENTTITGNAVDPNIPVSSNVVYENVIVAQPVAPAA